MKKGLYSLPALRELCAANRRYLEFISAVDTPTAGIDALRKISATLHEGEHIYPGFTFFAKNDHALMEALVRGENCIRGLSNKSLRRRLRDKTSGQITRILKRLRTHDLIKRSATRTITTLMQLGRIVVTAGLKIKQLALIPYLAAALA